MGILLEISFSENVKRVKLNSTNSPYGDYSQKFNAKDYIGLKNNVWKNGLTGKNITVVILDTGIYPNHDVFTKNGTLNWNKRILAFYDEKINGISDKPHDISYHGTWTASILGGNSIEYIGVAPGVNFVIMKVFDIENGELISSVSVIKDAIDWIINNKDKYNIKIASMSFGLKPDSEYLDDIEELNQCVEKLVKENILVVASAGNYGSTLINDGDGSITAPASEKSVIAVGGVNYDGEMYLMSGKGPTHEGVIKPDVCAPSVNVLGAKAGTSKDAYESYSGTSAATPFVSGLAALMLEKDEELTPLKLKSIISLTSFRTLNPRVIKDNTQGWGIIQGHAALNALEDPMTITHDTEFEVSLNENIMLFCQPITLEPNHYFFELNQLDSAEAEIYLFNSEPDQYGNPILVSHSINDFILKDPNPRMGAFAGEIHDYYLVIKLIHGTGKGDFVIKLVIEFRNGIIIALTAINIVAIAIIGKEFINFRKEKKKQTNG